MIITDHRRIEISKTVNLRSAQKASGYTPALAGTNGTFPSRIQ